MLGDVHHGFLGRDMYFVEDALLDRARPHRRFKPGVEAREIRNFSADLYLALDGSQAGHVLFSRARPRLRPPPGYGKRGSDR